MRYLDVATTKKISKIGLGTWQFGSEEWGYGEKYAHREARAIVRRALDLGVTLFDTAEIYGSGQSERILGHALGEQRESAFVATKIWPIVTGERAVKRRALASLHRLGGRWIDLYQVHWPNPLARDRAIMRGMGSLRRAKVIGDVGVSSYSLERWHATEDVLGNRVLSNQVGYSLLDRSPEQDLIPFAESTGHVVVAASPLARGLLAGGYHGVDRPADKIRTTSPLFDPANLERTGNLIAVLGDVADAHDATRAQVALAWAIRSPAVAAIPGASSVEQLESNVAAAEIELAEDEYQALETTSAQAVPRTTSDTSPLSKLRDRLHSLRHTARGGKYLAKTIRNDHKLTISNCRGY